MTADAHARGAAELAVVVPTHQTRELTVSCLTSVVAADPGIEIVVVDDGSTDGTAETVLRRFPAVRLVRNEERRGFTPSANRGVAASTAPVVLLLNSDTEVPRDTAKRLRAAFAADPRLAIAGAQLVYPDGTRQWSGGREPGLAWFFLLGTGGGRFLSHLRRTPRDVPAGSAREVGWVSGAAFAARRDAWDAIGGLDERFGFYAQDLDLCLRCREAGWSVALLPDLHVVHHHGATIGRLDPSRQVRRQQPDLLWCDLLLWAELRRGRAWARRAKTALRIGVRLRLLARAAARPFTPEDRLAVYRAETAALRAALRAVYAPRRPAAGGGRTGER